MRFWYLSHQSKSYIKAYMMTYHAWLEFYDFGQSIYLQPLFEYASREGSGETVQTHLLV